MMSRFDINKSYVSPIDQFLYAFDASHAKTESQLKEIEKHKKIANLRDNAQEMGDEEIVWKEF